MYVPGKVAVEMKSKVVFDMVLLRYLHIIYMDRWARFASRSERHMDRLSFMSFHTQLRLYLSRALLLIASLNMQ
jgi:hypothetical protein